MLVSENDQDSLFTFESLFKKKFSNFVSKAPVLLSFELFLDKVTVKEVTKNIIKDFYFDKNVDVKQNIKLIKDWMLANIYPFMIQNKKVFSDYTADELESFVNKNGMTLNQVVLMKKEHIEKIVWRIERIIIKKDELFVQNLKTGKKYRFKMAMPSSLFLKKMREDWSPEAAYLNFEKKSILLNEVYDIVEKK